MPNRKLAEAMISAGIPFANHDEGGPCQNHYTPALLRDRGWAKGDLPPKAFEERVLAVAQSGAVNAAGTVVFLFERSAEAEALIKAWDETAQAVRLAREWAGMPPEQKAMVQPPPALPDLSASIVAQVLCLHANNMKLMPQIIFSRAPICNMMEADFHQGESKGGAHVTSTGVSIGETTGSGKAWSTDLDNDKRAKMGLHPRIKVWANPHAK